MRHGSFFTNPQHPPLAKEVMAAVEGVFGQSPEAVRGLTIAVVAATAVVLGLLGHELAGRWAGLAAAALLVLVSWPSPEWDVERLGILDPYMALGTTVALYGAVRWWRTGQWKWALVTGVAVGAAAACKLPGVLVVPAAFGLPLVASRFARDRLVQAAGAIGAALVVFTIPFAPSGSYILTRMWHTIANQSENSDEGHNVRVAGHIYAHPPWWTGPYEVAHANPALAILLAACVIAAPFVLPRMIAAFLLTAVLVPALFFAFVSGVQLPHYPYAYAPAAALLMGVVGAGLTRHHRARVLAPVLVGVAALAIGVSVYHSATQRRGDAQRVATMLAPYLTRGTAVVAASPHGVLGAYMPNGVRQVVINRADKRVVAVVVDPAWVSINPTKRRLQPIWQQAIAGRRPVRVGSLRVYLLDTNHA